MKESAIYGTYESLKTITHKKYSLMNIAYTSSQDFSFFSDAKVQLEQITKRLQSNHYHNKEHGDIEQYIDKEGREIFRCLLKGWLDIITDDDSSTIKPITASAKNLTLL